MILEFERLLKVVPLSDDDAFEALFFEIRLGGCLHVPHLQNVLLVGFRALDEIKLRFGLYFGCFLFFMLRLLLLRERVVYPAPMEAC